MKNIEPKLISLFKEGYCTPQIARIARTIKEPSSTIHYNIKKLEREKAIRAYKAVFDHKKIGKGCDEIVKKLAQSDLTVNEAVCFALIARHFKRITSHLTNIATSVVLPLSDIDYFDEKRIVK